MREIRQSLLLFAMIGLVMITLATCTGCGDNANGHDPQAMQGAVAASLAMHTSQGSDVPLPGPVSKEHQREDCPTGGWVLQDGQRVRRCPECRPKYTDDTPQTSQIDRSDWKLVELAISEESTNVQVTAPARQSVCVGGKCYAVAGGQVFMDGKWRPVGPCLRPGCTCKDPAKCIAGTCDGCTTQVKVRQATCPCGVDCPCKSASSVSVQSQSAVIQPVVSQPVISYGSAGATAYSPAGGTQYGVVRTRTWSTPRTYRSTTVYRRQPLIRSWGSGRRCVGGVCQ